MSGEEVSRAPVEARSTPAMGMPERLQRIRRRTARYGFLQELELEFLSGPAAAVVRQLDRATRIYISLPQVLRGARALRGCAEALVANLRGDGGQPRTRRAILEAIRCLNRYCLENCLSDRLYHGNLVFYALQCTARAYMDSSNGAERRVLMHAVERAHQALGTVGCEGSCLSEEEMFLLFMQQVPYTSQD